MANSCGIPHSLKMIAATIRHRFRRLTRPSARIWLALVAVWVLVAVLAMAAAGEIARRQARGDLARQAEAAAALHAAVLRSELEKHRSLPVVLAQDPEVIAMLAAPTAASQDQVSAKLERLAGQTRAAAIYVLDASGVARAASNWRLPTSFVGSDYSFRPYFTEAMSDGDAEFFALGTVSGRPGLYLARRLNAADGAPLGVVVVKVEFDALEADWRTSGEPAFVADDRGVILVTSVPGWRFRSVGPIDPALRHAILEGQTLGREALRPLPFPTPADGAPGLVRTAVDRGAATDWVSARADTATPGWTLHLLTPAANVIRTAVLNARAVAGLMVTLLAVGAAVLLRRRQLAAARAVAEEASRAELERRIDERTLELRTANTELNREIEERHRAEASREILREELVQATKLATLGQIAAGVAHEINQPVAAIHTHADTAAAYLDRADEAGARRSLGRIADMTARIGAITDELRAFSRKSTLKASPVSPDAAIDGALLLMGGRLAESGIRIVRQDLAGVAVIAERVRLEQVLLNLIQNAAEAMEDAGSPAPTLSIVVARRRRRIEIAVADNGPGVSPEAAATLFTPFTTTKATGLGLGLVICRDIIAGFGGELVLKPSDAGATFIISLKEA